MSMQVFSAVYAAALMEIAAEDGTKGLIYDNNTHYQCCGHTVFRAVHCYDISFYYIHDLLSVAFQDRTSLQFTL